MPKAPETTAPKRAAGPGGRVALGAAGVAAVALGALYLRSFEPDEPAQASRPGLAETLADVRRSLAEAQPAPAEEPPVGSPRAGSMQESLLESPAANRNHLFWRAIADTGFVCPELKSASAVGSGGSAWRANCGETNIYFIEVDDFGRLSVVPMRSSDGLTPVPILVFPDDQ